MYRARGRLMKEVHELFEGLDALVLPARGKGEEGAMGNVLGLPQIVFPTGYDLLRGNSQSPRRDPQAQVWFGLAYITKVSLNTIISIRGTCYS